MAYADELQYLYSHRNSRHCPGEEIDKILQRFNDFCGKWHGKATASQVWDFMKLFHNDAPTEQNEFVYYVIYDIVERFPVAAISEIIRNFQYLEQTEGRECAFYLIVSICRKEEYIKHCIDALNTISISDRTIIWDELRKNGGKNAAAIIKASMGTPCTAEK